MCPAYDLPVEATATTASLAANAGAVLSNIKQLTIRNRGDLPGRVQVTSDTVSFRSPARALHDLPAACQGPGFEG